MAEPTDEMLREAARARGFRLVKSRRRKPGGDFGRYGLVDLDSGRECMGFGEDGLTADADEVLAYLRGGEVASWKRSLIGVVGDEPVKPKKPKREAVKEDAATSARPERSRRASALASDRDAGQERVKKETPARTAHERPSTSLRTSGKGSARHKLEEGQEQEDQKEPAEDERPEPVPEPAIREATRRDAAAIAKLLGVPAAALAERLGSAIRADEPPLVAEAKEIVAVAAWTTLATLQHGTLGRITALTVAREHRRQGLGARLLAEAEQRLRDAGIEKIELALEIGFDAPAGFLRRTGFARTAHGDGKTLD